MMPSLLEGNSLFRNVYCFLAANEGNQAHCTPAGATVLKDGILPAGWEWVAFALAGFSIAMLVLNLFLVLVMFYTYMERRLLGRFQSRIGPNRAGPFGLLQPVADAIKLLTKESIIPEGTDRWLYNLAPVVMVVPVFLILAVLPFGKNSFIANINVGVLFVLLGVLPITIIRSSSENSTVALVPSRTCAERVIGRLSRSLITANPRSITR